MMCTNSATHHDFGRRVHDYFKKSTTPKQFRKKGPHFDDDDYMDKMLLIVLDDVPVQTINDILAGNMAHFDVPRSDVWLADDDYENLPDFNGAAFIEGTRPTVEATWRSPFIGKTLAEAVTWVRGVPKPPKPMCKKFFAVLQKELYESKGEVLICKVKKNKSEPQTIRYNANHIAAFRAAYYRDNWQEDWEMQFRD